MTETNVITDLLLPRHLNALKQFLATTKGIVFVRYAADHTILAVSDGFTHQLSGADAIIGESINRFLCDPDGRECSLLSTPTSELPVFFTAKLRGGEATYQCCLYADEGDYLLIGDRLGETPDETVERMSLMTNELASMTIELRKRNVELEKANDVIRELTRVDPLTNLANRRRFAEALDACMTLAQRHREPLSLISIDIDRFKSVNDTYGHNIGDDVLKRVADLLRESCRNEDLPVRLGGEEFLVLCAKTAIDEAYTLAERLRVRLPALPGLPSGVHISASFGVAQLLPQDTYFAFLKRADMALYEAKSEGRNRTVTRISNDPKR
jgi:diguanylate cyclase (GGDEF)-like protein